MKLDTQFQYRCYNDHPSIKAQGKALFAEFQSTRKRKIVDKNDQNNVRRAFIVALPNTSMIYVVSHLCPKMASLLNLRSS
jgi:hypothetical protein